MKNILGVVFSDMHEHMMSDLTPHRCMGSIPIGGRYRLVDFVLSSLVNSGIEDVGVITSANYQCLTDHLGNGREWDLNRKKGGLVVLSPLAHGGVGMYRGRIEALHGIMDFIKNRGAQHVLTTDCDIMINTTFDEMFASHQDTGADITIMYKKMELRESAAKDTVVLNLGAGGKVVEVLANPQLAGQQNVYLNIMIISRSLLEYVVGNCYSRNLFSFERDVLQAGLSQYNINAFEYTGYVSRLSSLQTYYSANLSLLDHKVKADLFPPGLPVYTNIEDEAPVRYGLNAKVSNSLLADGCLVEGEVEGCVLFRGVTVGKGAKIKNSVIMQGTVIGENSNLDCVITDTDVTIRDGRVLAGFHTYPVYISKGAIV